MNQCIKAVVLVLVSVLACGCGDEKAKASLESAKNMAKNANVKLSELVARGKAAVSEAAKDQAADIDQIIADFKEKASKASGDAKVKVEEGIKALEAKRAPLQAKLDQLKDAGEETWKKVAEEIDTLVADMRKTIADIRAK